MEPWRVTDCKDRKQCCHLLCEYKNYRLLMLGQVASAYSCRM